MELTYSIALCCFYHKITKVIELKLRLNTMRFSAEHSWFVTGTRMEQTTTAEDLVA